MGTEITKFADVICQHTTDGAIIPIRLRIKDEDGVFHEYNIKGYKDLTHSGQYTLPNGTMVNGNHIHSFECKIVVFNQVRILRLIYNAYDCRWKIISIS